ncbi:MAG: hypothetical protein ACREDE_09985, partial [Thermoplasmata archaeon]
MAPSPPARLLSALPLASELQLRERVLACLAVHSLKDTSDGRGRSERVVLDRLRAEEGDLPERALYAG